MGFYALSAEINALTSLLLVFFILRRGRERLHLAFAFFAGTVFLWSQFYFFWQVAPSHASALFFTKLLTAVSAFIPSSFFYFSMVLIEREQEERNSILMCFALSVMFFVLSFTGYLVQDVQARYGFPFWPSAGGLYWAFIAFYAGAVLQSHYLMYKRYSFLSGISKEQIKYVSLGTLIGFAGGATNFPLWFNINIPPVGNLLVSAYVLLTGYAVIRYRLMDIRVAVTSAGLFIVVYALFLGMPFYLMANGYSWIALVSMAILASLAPVFYSNLSKRATDSILNEQRAYQDVLLNASLGLSKLIKVDEIINFIVKVLSQTIKIRNVAFYLYDGEKYKLMHCVGKERHPEIPMNNNVCSFLKTAGPIIIDELKYNTVKLPGSAEVVEFFNNYPAYLVVPVIERDLVIGLIFLGEKINNAPFTNDDLDVFMSVAAHAATAIENAILFESATKTMEEEMHDHRLRDMGVIGASISHQVGNRLQLVVRFLETLAVRFKAEKLAGMSKEEILTKLNSSMEQFPEIVDNAIKAAEISDALRTQGKLSQDAHAITLKRLVKMARTLAYAKHPGFNCELVEDFADDLTLWANESSMQDILLNLFDNSLDAIQIRMRGKSLPPSYVGKITVKAWPEGDMAKIIVEDNGIGLRPADLAKAFVPHYTTKGTEKGTGLGLYIIHQFVRHSKGTISVDSVAGEWARFTITFPLATP